MKVSEYALALAVLISPLTASYTSYRIVHCWRRRRGLRKRIGAYGRG